MSSLLNLAQNVNQPRRLRICILLYDLQDSRQDGDISYRADHGNSKGIRSLSFCCACHKVFRQGCVGYGSMYSTNPKQSLGVGAAGLLSAYFSSNEAYDIINCGASGGI